MSVIGSNALAGASGQGGDGFVIEKSLRFTKGDGAYLSRTFSESSSKQKFTFSVWFKGAVQNSHQYLLQTQHVSSSYFEFTLNNYRLQVYNAVPGINVTLERQLRDPSAWYHAVLAVDTTQAVEADRLKIYLNGEHQTDYASGGSTFPAQNAEFDLPTRDWYIANAFFNSTSQSANFFDGYMADFHYVDGEAKDVTDFGAFDEYGVWQPIEFTGSHNFTPTVTYPAVYVTSPGTYGTVTDVNTVNGSVFTSAGSTGASGSIKVVFESPITGVTHVKFKGGGYALSSGFSIKVNGSTTHTGLSTNSSYAVRTETLSSATDITSFEIVSTNDGWALGDLQFSTDGTNFTAPSGTAAVIPDAGVNGFHLNFADGIGTDNSGNNNDWTVNNLSSGVYSGTKPKWYTSTTLYTTKADVIANATDRGQSAFTLSSEEFVYLVPNDGGAVGELCHPTGSQYPALFYVYVRSSGDTSWYNTGSHGATEAGTFQWENTTGTPQAYDYTKTEDLYLVGDTRNGGQPDANSKMSGTFPALVNFVAQTDVLRDSPTNGDPADDTGVGGEVSGNYCTWNPLKEKTGGYNMAYADGNLELSAGGDGVGTIPFTSGKKYFELTIKSASAFAQGYYGIVDINQGAPRAWATSQIAAFRDVGSLYGDSSTGSAPAATQVGDVYGFAVDVDNQKLFISVNGTYLNSANPANGTGASFTGRDFSNYVPLASLSSANSQVVVLNAGQRPFNTAAPSGFKALCTANLPTPDVPDGSVYLDVKTWDGNGSTQSITGYEFSPDLVWIKKRSGTSDHALFDTIRGATKRLYPNDTSGQDTLTDTLTAFNSDGFSLGNANDVNQSSSQTYVGWAWDAGDSTVSNTDGDITSSVRANPSAGFSIVKWTSPTWSGSSGRQVGHGLGAAPAFIITKGLDTTGGWYTYHKDLDDTNPNDYYLTLNSTDARSNLADSFGPNIPNSTTFGDRLLGFTEGEDSVAFCFAPVSGFSAFGSYTGNGTTDGPFVYTGFRPRLILIKDTVTNAYRWNIYDSERDTYNVSDAPLETTSASETGTTYPGKVDFLSTGFKIRSDHASSYINTSGNKVVYAAFAENPFQANGGLAR